MNTAHSLVLAGKLDDLGNSWIDMFTTWGSRGLKAALIVIVVVYMVQRFSIKAGIGALLLMAIALGIYSSRDDLAATFTDQIKNPTKKSAPAITVPVRPLTGASPQSGGEL
ncbi:MULTISPECIES: hypothetical protein [Streptomyces]|uniref:hypothetical protein n=1 Tax=Streptomyces TaxID=1883 RepID=UPI00167A9809|nr:hypothetical protein [Streptomyces xanthochromogenes]GHB71437.1 hypothetical protein GCM10010331_69170 [Streptomyces xanthochromogenes]